MSYILGIKPIYVFDGKPPERKNQELAKRLERRMEAEQQIAAAKETGDTAQLDKFNRRTVKVTKKHNDDCKKLLKLMGVPFIQAPCEAEAQCAALVRDGFAYAVGSEDMDTLTFASPILLRHLTSSEAKKLPIQEYHLNEVLKGLEMTMNQFIDLCILLGCDYCDSIKGVGPAKAISLIKQYGSIESVIKNIDQEKYKIPSDWSFEEARELFLNHEVLKESEEISSTIKWEKPNEEELIKFMVMENAFNEKRIRLGLEKINRARSTATQGRLDSFFTSVKRKGKEKENKEEAPVTKTETESIAKKKPIPKKPKKK